MSTSNALRAIALILIATLLMSGCNALGPRALQAGRAGYNLALQQTDNRELLLNLVRLKYNELPFFLEVTSISTSPSISISSSLNASLLPGESDPYDYKVFDLQYTERPTITYVPLGGERFARQLMTPVDLQTLGLLFQAGWDLDRILRLCVQSINGVPNAKEAAGPTPRKEPHYKVFQRVAVTLRRLDEDGHLSIGRSNEGDDVEVQIAIDPMARQDADVIRFFEDLRLDPKAPHYLLTNAVSGGGGQILAVVTRPLTGTMFYLSQGVDVPEQDRARAIVTTTRTNEGQPFEWESVTRGLLNVRSSTVPPSNAFVAVPFRNAWFYITDSDVESRKTFALLNLLLTLQAGEVPKAGPILTLPVGSP